MYLGFRGLRNVIKYAHSKVFILVFLGYIVVGLGSMAFHTTLKCKFSLSDSVRTCPVLTWNADEMQLADELPMIYTICIMAYVAFGTNKSPAVKGLLAVFLLGLATFITVYYLYAKDPVFHQVAYGLLTASTIFRGFHVLEGYVKQRVID